MTMVAGALFFFTASTYFKARLSSHIDGPIFFVGSDCTGKETDPGYSITDETFFGGANSKIKEGGVSFYIAAALVFISGPVGTCGLCPVIVLQTASYGLTGGFFRWVCALISPWSRFLFFSGDP